MSETNLTCLGLLKVINLHLSFDLKFDPIPMGKRGNIDMLE